MILVKFKFVKLTHRNRIPKIRSLARAVCVNHWDGVRVVLYFLCLVVETGGEGGIWYTMVLMSSSRHQATLHRSVAFDCSNLSFLFRQRKMTPPKRVRSFSLAEKEGFEPSIPFWGIHDFQSCALGQLRDFSMRLASQPAQISYYMSAVLSTPYFVIFSSPPKIICASRRLPQSGHRRGCTPR